MTLKERIEKASSYRGTDFFSAESIGVISRGPSVYRIDKCCDRFSHCFLSGEFNHSLRRLKPYLRGKDMVLCVMQQNRYMTPESVCREFNINNLQVRFQNGSREHKECQEKYPYVKVVGFSKKHYDITGKIGEENKIFSTGMSPLISALYFSPKEIHIIGIDFYNKNVKPYFVREDHDIAHIGQIEKSIKGFRAKMLEGIDKICDNFREIDFYLYTTYRMVRPKRNLHIIYV